MLGLSFAACFPDRVSCLALVGCGTYDEECRAQFRSRLDALMDDATRPRLEALKLRAVTEVDPDVRDALDQQRGDLTMSLESYELIDSVDDPSDALAYTVEQTQKPGMTSYGCNAKAWSRSVLVVFHLPCSCFTAILTRIPVRPHAICCDDSSRIFNTWSSKGAATSHGRNNMPDILFWQHF